MVKPRARICALAAAYALGCDPVDDDRLADCDALRDQQPACMDDQAMQDCSDANENCLNSGDVTVAECCPLQFTCSEPVSD